MKIHSLFLTLFCGICFSGYGQVDAFQENIIEYLNSNGTASQYVKAYDEMFDVLKQQFVEPKVPENVWSELKEGKAESIQEVLSFLTFAYRKHFTEEDIAKMNQFYKTDAAQKMVTKTYKLTKEESEQVAAFFNSDLGQKIETKREDLSVDIAEISSHWSRELFTEKMSILVKKGYKTHW